eukprot:350388-Chlamydomonas_euryale.AAC.28
MARPGQLLPQRQQALRSQQRVLRIRLHPRADLPNYLRKGTVNVGIPCGAGHAAASHVCGVVHRGCRESQLAHGFAMHAAAVLPVKNYY